MSKTSSILSNTCDVGHDRTFRNRVASAFLPALAKLFRCQLLQFPDFLADDASFCCEQLKETMAKPRQQILDESDLALDRYDGNVFVITMRKAPENRLNSKYAQKLIGAFNKARELLGTSTEGAVITKGNDAKFWCTVSSSFRFYPIDSCMLDVFS